MPEVTTLPFASQLLSGDVLPLVRVIAGKPQPYQIAGSAIQAAIETAVIVEEVVTGGNVPTLVPNLPVIPAGGGYCFLQGTIIAQDQTTRDLAVWNIALAVSRAANASPVVVGDNTPSVFTQNGTTQNCSLTLGAGAGGPTITLTGFGGGNVSWGINLNSTEGD